MSLQNDDVNLNDVGEDEISTEPPQSDIIDESTDPVITIVNPIEYDEIDFEDDDFQGGPGAVIPTITPDQEIDPVAYPTMVQRTYTTKITITDYSSEFLEDLHNQGSEFHVVYADGTDEIISWQNIVDPNYAISESVSSEILGVMEAVGQHFWTGDDGIHVTELEEEDYLQNKSGHGMLINSYGLLMSRDEFNLVGITQSAITFYDGSGNDSTNIMALFGPTTIIGRENKAHVQINYKGFDIYNKNEESIATIKTLNDEDGSLTATVRCHLTKILSGSNYVSIRLGLAATGYRAKSIISIRTNTDPSTVIVNDTITFSNTSSGIYDVDFPEGNTYYSALEPYVDQDVLVTLYTDILYNEYSFGSRNTNYKPGLNSFVIGESNSATGLASIAFGENNEALGSYAEASGYDTYAAGVGSHTEGYQTIAQAPYYGTTGYNHAEGYQTETHAIAGHSEGCGTKVTPQGMYGHAEGYHTIVGYKKDLWQDTLDREFERAFPIASYPDRVYVDRSTDTYMAFTFYPDSNMTPGTASNFNANYRYLTRGMAAHSEGYYTEARADHSHSSGCETLVDKYSYAGYAGGVGTVSKSYACTVIGAYNNYSFDTDDGMSYMGQTPFRANEKARIFVVGDGSSDNDRSNALTVNSTGTWIKKLEFNELKTCPYPIGSVFFTTTNYGTSGPTNTVWNSGYNQATGQYTYPTWTKLNFTAISGVYAYKRVS